MAYKTGLEVNRATAHGLVALLAALLLAAALASCGGGKGKAKSREQMQRMATLDDSIAHKSPVARQMIDQAIAQAKGDSMARYEALSRLARWYLVSPSPDSALALLPSIERFASRDSSARGKRLLAYAYNARAGYYHNFHKHTEETIDLYGKAYSLLMRNGGETQAPDVCANLGDAYFYLNQLPQAASWYRRALFVADSLRLPMQQSLSLYIGLASIYQQLGDTDRALALYGKTDKHFDEMTLSMQCYFLNNYGNSYYYRKDYKRAYDMFMRLKRHLEQNGMGGNFDMYLCKTNLADVCLNLGSFKQARQYIDEAEPFWQRAGDATALYYCTTIRLGIATGMGNVAEAKKILASEKPAKGMMQNMVAIRNRYMRKYYALTGNWREAYFNLRADVDNTDSLEHSQERMRAADIMAQYSQDTLRLHDSVRMEHKAAEASNTRSWLIGMAAAAITLLLLLLLWILSSRRHRLLARLQVLQLRLENARGRISPHFVFNVLNNRIIDASSEESKELQSLTKLIRANLDMAGNMTVTLAEELDFVAKYVNVEKLLLANADFEYLVKLGDGVDPSAVKVPSMFIQILVENCFVHGLRGLERHKELTVEVTSSDDAINIRVADNGPGFDPRSQHGGRMGLNIIRQTLAVINEQNKKHRKARFALHNITGNGGKVLGCEAILTLPYGIKYPE